MVHVQKKCSIIKNVYQFGNGSNKNGNRKAHEIYLIVTCICFDQFVQSMHIGMHIIVSYTRRYSSCRVVIVCCLLIRQDSCGTNNLRKIWWKINSITCQSH